GMTFYEIRAKSIINKVPGASRVPFQWTINPYRGCSHACSYCLAGDTPILLADGPTRPLAQLRPGDAVMGTMGAGPHRRYVPTGDWYRGFLAGAFGSTGRADRLSIVFTSRDHGFLRRITDALTHLGLPSRSSGSLSASPRPGRPQLGLPSAVGIARDLWTTL